MLIDHGPLAPWSAKIAGGINGAEHHIWKPTLAIGRVEMECNWQITKLDRRDPECMESTRMVWAVTFCNPDHTMVAETVFRDP